MSLLQSTARARRTSVISMAARPHKRRAAARAVALALLTVAALPPLASPAAAAPALSITASKTSLDANQNLSLSGKVSGTSSAAKILRQEYVGSRWVTQSSLVPRGGYYSMSFTRRSFGTAKYRTLATDKSGRVLATSRTVAVSWFTWQRVALADQQDYSNSTFSAQMHNDYTYSFAGTAYAHSIAGSTNHINGDDVDEVRNTYLLNRACTAVRYTLGMDSANPPGSFNARVTALRDGAEVSTVVVGSGTKTAVQFGTSGATQLRYVIRIGANGASSGSDRVRAVIGTPQARCKADIEHYSPRSV